MPVRKIGTGRSAATDAADVILVDGQTGLQQGSASAPLYVVPGSTSPSSASTVGANSSVAGSATNVALLASNTSRKAAAVINDSTATMYVACGFTASATAYTAKLDPGDRFDIYGFTGAINGLWSSATGNARLTEFT